MSETKTPGRTRRFFLEFLHKLSERVHGAVLVFGIFFVLSSVALAVLELLSQNPAAPVMRPEVEAFSHGLERGLLGLDLVGLLLVGTAVTIRRFGFRSAAGSWKSPMSRYDIEAARKWLHGDQNALGIPGKLEVEFVSPELEPALTALNFEGFRDGAFATEFPKLEKRNRSWIEKNQKIFLLMRSPIPGTAAYMGYSSFVPLTENGAELYRSGVLRDSDIPVELICKPDERPGCILLFAIMLEKNFKLSRTGFSKIVYSHFQNCIAWHLRQVYEPWIESGNTPPLLAQIELLSLERKLRDLGFKKTPENTGDGYPLFELEQPFVRREAAGAPAGKAKRDWILVGVGLAMLFVVVSIIALRGRSPGAR